MDNTPDTQARQTPSEAPVPPAQQAAQAQPTSPPDAQPQPSTSAIEPQKRAKKKSAANKLLRVLLWLFIAAAVVFVVLFVVAYIAFDGSLASLWSYLMAQF